MIQMISTLDKTNFIPVDEWDTEENPADDADRIFRSVRGEIILPFTDLFCNGDDEKRQLNYFVMTTKRGYNSDKTRNHICKYLNYFEKFYDTDKELLSILYEMKLCIDYNKLYTKSNFMADVNRYIIRNTNLCLKIRRFVDDNYTMKLSSYNNKTPNLQFSNSHAKVLYEISLLINIYIPLATHYMYVHFIKTSVQDFMLKLFDMCCVKYEEERGIYIYDKLYETATSVVNKSKNPDRILWEKNAIRGINTTTHIQESVYDIILQIIPKYDYQNNIINFNYFSNRQSVKYKVTDISYEYPFVKLSSSKRDIDQNSELDKFESRLTKKDEALYLQNKIAAESTVNKIKVLYGPFSDDEINYYRKRLIRDGKPVINQFQKQLIGYLFFKEFGDPISLNTINQTQYIILIIAAKRILLEMGMIILPYIISSRVSRVATRKNITKKEQARLEASQLYHKVKEKYNNPKVEAKILDLIGKIISSKFEIIDWDDDNKCPGAYDNLEVPIINDIIDEEIILFTCTI